jgi:flagellar protein FliL
MAVLSLASLLACRTESADTGPVKSTLHLETFVMNLADPGQRSYLRVGIDLGLSREFGRGSPPPPVAEARDTILSVLGRAQADDVSTEKGKEKLKADLVHALQQRIPQLGVEEVYFTEFLIQR